jgi:hypothetical protein
MVSGRRGDKHLLHRAEKNKSRCLGLLGMTQPVAKTQKQILR